MIYLAVSLIFISVYLAASTLIAIFFPVRTVLNEALDVYDKAWEKNHPERIARRSGRLGGLIDITQHLAKRFGYRGAIQERLDKSGLDADAGRFILFHVSLMTAAGLTGLIIFNSWILSMSLIAVATFAPLFWLRILKGKREKRFHQQLPETLLLIAGSLKAGYSFMQAVDTIVKETTPPMSVEFKKVLAESQLGLPVEQAMEKMSANISSRTFGWVVMAVKIQREVGGNLAEVLETLAEAIRERDQVDRQVKVLTAEGRLSALILFLLPFVLGLVLALINRSYIALLFNNFAGLLMVGVTLILMGLGALWLRKIVRIEV